jgi:hypothetical protein
MGFGHRVYKNYDPRARIMARTCAEVLDELDRSREAEQWRARADVAQLALDEAFGTAEEAEEFEVYTEYDEPAAPDFSTFVTADELPDEVAAVAPVESSEEPAVELPDEPLGDDEAPKVAE